MTCRLCERERELVDSHIIPRSFYEIGGKKSKDITKIVSNTKGFYPKKSPKGIYEQIVCLECENKFSPWDDYAFRFLVGNSKRNKTTPRNNIVGLEVRKFDYLKLKLFFLSLLWRSNVATDPFFGKVNLGSHESIIKGMIRDGEPGGPEDYSVLISKFNYPGELIPILSPDLTDYDGINTYRFYLAGFMVLIKVDDNLFKDPFDSLVLSQHPPLHIILREYEDSKEKKVMVKMVRSQKKPPFPNIGN